MDHAEEAVLKVVEPEHGGPDYPAHPPALWRRRAGFHSGRLLPLRSDVAETAVSWRKCACWGRKTVEWMLQNHLPEGIHPMGELAQWLRAGRSGAAASGAVTPPRLGRQIRLGRRRPTRKWWIDPAEKLPVPDHAAVHAVLYYSDRGGFCPTSLPGRWNNRIASISITKGAGVVRAARPPAQPQHPFHIAIITEML